MPVVRECIEVDPSHKKPNGDSVAMGRTSPDYPDAPIDFVDRAWTRAGWWLEAGHGDGERIVWRKLVPEGETLTVYAEEGEG